MTNIYNIFTGELLPTIEIVTRMQKSDWSYADIRSRIEARFGDKLPKHFTRAIYKPQVKPYMYGDPHNVIYRTKSNNFNKPMPVPCEVTLDSCAKLGDMYELGAQCLAGIDEPLPWMDAKYRVTLNFLKSLPRGSKVYITTRSDLIAHDDYIDAIRGLDVTINILIPMSVSGEELRRLEPGAPSIERRQIAIAKLKSLGFNCSSKYHRFPRKIA